MPPPEKDNPPALAEALMAQGEDGKEKAAQVAEDLRQKMEAAGSRIRELISAQPPNGLLGYIWSQFMLGNIMKDGPDTDLVKRFQFILDTSMPSEAG